MSVKKLEYCSTLSPEICNVDLNFAFAKSIVNKLLYEYNVMLFV